MLDELRYVWRQLRRTPGFTGVAVLTLALGIGANTAFFGLIDAILWRPLRGIELPDAYEIYVQRPGPTRVQGNRFELNYRILTRAQLDYLKSLPEIGVLAVAGVNGRRVIAQTPTEAGRLSLEITFGDYAGVCSLRPILGQLTGLQNDGAQAGPRVVISERLWRSWFRGDRNAVGRDTLRINRRTFTIAGVLPRSQSFRGVDVWVAAETWHSVEPEISESFGSTQLRFRPGSESARLRAVIDHALASGPTPPPTEFQDSPGEYAALTGRPVGEDHDLGRARPFRARAACRVRQPGEHALRTCVATFRRNRCPHVTRRGVVARLSVVPV